MNVWSILELQIFDMPPLPRNVQAVRVDLKSLCPSSKHLAQPVQNVLLILLLLGLVFWTGPTFYPQASLLAIFCCLFVFFGCLCSSTYNLQLCVSFWRHPAGQGFVQKLKLLLFVSHTYVAVSQLVLEMRLTLSVSCSQYLESFTQGKSCFSHCFLFLVCSLKSSEVGVWCGRRCKMCILGIWS